jgi:hypothetical protein
MLIRYFSRANPTAASLSAFNKELKARSVSDDTAALFGILMRTEPVLRLSVNLKHVLVESALGPVRNWKETLAPEEREALTDLQDHGFASEHMEVAHGLLNIHERWSVMKATAKAFREARGLGERVFKERPLDGILR